MEAVRGWVWLFSGIAHYMLTRGLSDRSDFAFAKCVD